MDEVLKGFALQWFRVAAITMVPVVFVAFTSIPYSLGGHPGEQTARATTSAVHMS